MIAVLIWIWLWLWLWLGKRSPLVFLLLSFNWSFVCNFVCNFLCILRLYRTQFQWLSIRWKDAIRSFQWIVMLQSSDESYVLNAILAIAYHLIDCHFFHPINWNFFAIMIFSMRCYLICDLLIFSTKYYCWRQFND